MNAFSVERVELTPDPLLFAVFFIVCALVAIGGWTLFLRYQRQHPIARQLAPSAPAGSDEPVLWRSRGGIRLPLQLGGLSATWPLVSYSATPRGLHVRGTVVPSLDIPWNKMRRCEAVSSQAIRILVTEPNIGLMAVALQQRDAFLDLAEHNQVPVERKPQPAHWWSGAGL